MNGRDALTDALLDRQGHRTDGDFARELGCARATWGHVRLGTRRMGPRLIQQVKRTCPDLRALCDAALLGLGSGR